VLYVNSDGDVIGKSVFDTYQGLHGDSFPTSQPISSTKYPQEDDIREAVCRGGYWGAVYANAGGPEGLASALANGSRAPTSLTCLEWGEVPSLLPGRYLPQSFEIDRSYSIIVLLQ